RSVRPRAQSQPPGITQSAATATSRAEGRGEEAGRHHPGPKIVRICIIRSFIRVPGPPVADLLRPRVVRSSAQAAIAEIHRAVAEAALVEQLKLEPDIVR